MAIQKPPEFERHIQEFVDLIAPLGIPDKEFAQSLRECIPLYLETLPIALPIFGKDTLEVFAQDLLFTLGQNHRGSSLYSLLEEVDASPGWLTLRELCGSATLTPEAPSQWTGRIAGAWQNIPRLTDLHPIRTALATLLGDYYECQTNPRNQKAWA